MNKTLKDSLIESLTFSLKEHKEKLKTNHKFNSKFVEIEGLGENERENLRNQIRLTEKTLEQIHKFS